MFLGCRRETCSRRAGGGRSDRACPPLPHGGQAGGRQGAGRAVGVPACSKAATPSEAAAGPSWCTLAATRRPAREGASGFPVFTRWPIFYPNNIKCPLSARFERCTRVTKQSGNLKGISCSIERSQACCTRRPLKKQRCFSPSPSPHPHPHPLPHPHPHPSTQPTLLGTSMISIESPSARKPSLGHPS